MMFRAQGAWAQGTLKIRVSGLGGQWEREGARISDPIPCRHPSLPQGPQKAHLAPTSSGPRVEEAFQVRVEHFQWSPNVHPFHECLVELLMYLWLEIELGQQEEQNIALWHGFSLRGFIITFVQCLCGIFGNEFLQLDRGPQALGKGKALLSPPCQAEGKVHSHRAVAWGGQEGGREADMPPSHPERQRSEHLAASWRR